MAAAQNLFSGLILVLVSVQICLSDEDDSPSKKPMDMFGDTMKGMTGLFQGMAGGLKDKAEDGMEAFKGLSSGVKDMSEEGLETAKGWAEGLGDGLSKAKESMVETGENIKKTFGDTAVKTRDELENAASKLSKHAKEASDSLFKMFL